MWRILSDRKLAEYHGNAWRVLGYLGDARDAQKAEQVARTTYRGLLDYHERHALAGLFDALGVMSGRGIEAADNLVQRMASIKYWRQGPFQWCPAERLKKKPAFEYDPVAALLWGYSISGKRKRIGELSAAILDGIEDAETRRYVAWRLAPERLAVHPERVRRQEKLPLTAYWHKTLTNAYAEHAATIARLAAKENSPTEEESAFIRRVLSEALAALEKTKADILQGRLDPLNERLLDNGERIDKDKMERVGPELADDLRELHTVLEALAERKAEPVDIKVERLRTYELPSIPAQDGKIVASRSEDLTVSFRLTDTAEIGRALFRRVRGSRTVARDGSLIVYMKKIDGRWYWNPFGW